MLQSLPALLLILPLLAALVAWLLPSRWSRGTAGGGALLLVLFYLYLASLPLDFSATAAVEWELWGQTWLLTGGTWTILHLLYLGTAVLFLLVTFWPATARSLASTPSSSLSSEFVSAGLAALTPLAAALMLPTALGAVALLLAAICVSIMIRPATSAASGRAALRYFIFATLALPFLLLAGWMVSSEQLVFAGVVWRLLLLGFALLLAGFPFHIWVRSLVATAPPLLLPFLFGLVHLILLVYGFRLLQENPFLESTPQFYALLRWLGVGTAVVGAILAWKPRDRGRLLGALLLLDLGSSIMALSLGAPGIRPALLLIHSRYFSLLLVLVGLTWLRHPFHPGTESPSAHAVSQVPWASTLFVYGSLSLLGLPLTPGFAGRWALLSLVAANSLWPAVILLLATVAATAGLIVHLPAVMRPLMRPPLMRPLPGSPPADLEAAQPLPSPLQVISILLLVIAIILALFPAPLMTFAARLAQHLS